MNKLDLTCPHCHATMEINEANNYAVCKYCGHKILIEKKKH